MKIKYLAIFCCGFFTSTSLIAGIMREDVSVQDYRDFAENLGKYRVGEENIEVFKIDGTSAGTLAFPMPDFGAIVSGGYATLYSPSYLVGVQHNGGYKSVDFGNNAKYKTSYKLINRNEYSARDFHMPRLNKVVTEASPVPSIVGTQLAANPDRYTWYARAGAGTQQQVNVETQQLMQVASAYSWKSGGIMTNPTFESWRLRWYNYSPDDPKVQIFDSAAQGGDSGSPLFVYDNYEKKWKLVGVTTSGSGTPPYNMRTYNLFIQDKFVSEVIAANTDPDVTDIRSDGIISWNKDAITQGTNSWAWHGVETLLPSDATNNALDATKDLRFNGEGGTLVLDQSINHGAAKLQFSNDYRVTSADGQNNTWVGGGIDVDAGKTVLWQVNGLAGDALHKIGEGTLHVNANGVNGGRLNVGDGRVILDQQADENGLKQAFSTVTLVSGRPVVVLSDKDQVATKNIQFGYRGGTLDLNGTHLSFKEINHNDHGARLVNRNRAQTSSITLYGKGFNFLGHIGEQNSGKLNLAYYASDSAYRATLSGGTDVQALNVKRGELVLSGEQTLHAGNVLYADDWRFHSYLADTAKVLTGATLTVSDHAELSANTTVDEGAILNLYAHAALSGNLVLTGINSLLKADIVERNSTVAGLSSMITADVSGNGQLIKTGEGTLQVDGDITTTGDTELQTGTLALNGNVSSPVKMASGTVLAGSGTLQDLYAADQSTLYPGALFANTAQYATLRVGSLYNTGTVNVALNSDFSRTATDKLLVDGDVIGDKPIIVSVSSQSPWTDSDINQNSIADNTEGVSIIQVGGQSTKDSFALAGNYMARGAWAYGLYAFAPGKSAESERDVSGTGDQYWDYRLQNIMLSEGGNSTPVVPDETPAVVPDEAPAVVPDETPATVPDETPAASPPQPVKPVRRAVTPQVPSYISLPAALFRADEQRTMLFKESALDASLEDHSSFFLFGYRGEENYQSGNNFMQYGYNYKSRDKGWMMGANLASWQNEGQSLSVSGAFSKGDTTFTPDAADGDSQGSFHSNAVNLMVSWHNEDYYLNLLSGYGWSKGDITTNLRGKVASPHVKQTFAEIEGGKNLRFGAHRLRPYAGYRHQQMQVKSFTDVDNTRVNYQQQRREAWIGGLAYDYTLPLNRLGTLRLGTDVSLAMRPSGQGKVTIGDGQQSDAFRTGNGGDNLNIKTEAKLELSQDIALTTQIRHQRKLQQEGTNDWLFAGGINFYF